MALNPQLRYFEHDRQSLLDGVDDPGGHLRGGVPEVVGAVQLDRIQQGITVQLVQGGGDRGRADRAATCGGESGGELVDALGPAVAEE